eukprot:6195022-Pleurochrysis_carterae.AAC.7
MASAARHSCLKTGDSLHSRTPVFENQALHGGAKARRDGFGGQSVISQPYAMRRAFSVRGRELMSRVRRGLLINYVAAAGMRGLLFRIHSSEDSSLSRPCQVTLRAYRSTCR